jgi:hypothetical protein
VHRPVATSNSSNWFQPTPQATPSTNEASSNFLKHHVAPPASAQARTHQQVTGTPVTHRSTLPQPDRRVVGPSATSPTRVASASSLVPAPTALSVGSVGRQTFRRSACQSGIRFVSSSFGQHTLRQQSRQKPDASSAPGPRQHRFESSADSPHVRQTGPSGHQQHDRRAALLDSKQLKMPTIWQAVLRGTTRLATGPTEPSAA